MEDLATWLRRRIEQRRFLAQHAIELGNAAEWTELSSGVLMTSPPDAPQDWCDGVWAMGDSSLTRLIEANDPRDTIARCEVELAILDQHERLGVDDECARCVDWTTDQEGELCADPHDYPCRTVRLLAYGYRFRDGYAEVAGDWRP